MATISQQVGRGDFLLHRYCDERLGCRWMKWRPDTGQTYPVDLSNSRADLFLADRFGNPVKRYVCQTTAHGLVYADVPADDTAMLPNDGTWRISVKYEDKVVPLGWGQFTTA